MTGLRNRSPGGVPWAVAGAALLGLASMMPSMFVVGAHTVTTNVALLDDEALIMGGTRACCVTAQTPPEVPGPPYTTTVNQLFIAPNHPGFTANGLAITNQLAPFTGIHSEPLSTSVAQGVTQLNTAINEQLAQGNDVVVLGLSQSSTVASVEEVDLAALPAAERPSPERLSFVLLGNPNNPDGGLLERVTGAFPALGYTTPLPPTPDDAYPTIVYTGEYDGFADFPQYPTNLLADLNAILGVEYVHGEYPDLTAPSGAIEPVTSADTDTTYILIPTKTLPLLEPLQGIVPAPLLDLIEPDLRVIIDLGYDRTAPANVLTPAQLFPTDINPITVVEDLVKGTVQGVNNALTDVGLPDLPTQITGPITDLETSLGNLASEIDPAILAISASLQDALNNVTVPAQLADALGPIAGALNDLNALLNTVINDEINPAIQSTIYGVGDTLRAALTSAGAPAEVTNAVYVLEQILPIEISAPDVFVTVGAQSLVTAVDDLVAGNVNGFAQELINYLPATGIIGGEFYAAFGLEALLSIATGVTLGL